MRKMERATLGILGAGLLVLCLVGLATPSPVWLVWLDGLTGIWSLLVAGAVLGLGMRSSEAAPGWSLAIAAALLALWAGGFVIHERGWLLWWTFGFALAYLLVGVVLDLSRLRRSCAGPLGA